MKKLLFMMFAAAIAMTSCEKSVLAVDDSGATGDVVTLTVNAETIASTRALDGSNAVDPANYYLEVWLDGKQYLENQYSEDGKFDLQLINKQEYTLVAWADYDTQGADGYYDPTELTNVTVSTDAEVLAINTLNRDAFAGTKNITLSENDAVSMTLTRPFARVNVTTTDYAQITESFRPTDVKLSYTTVYTGYNVMAGTEGEGEVTGDTDGFVSEVTAFVDGITVDGNGNLQLSADYLFVPNDGATIEFTAEYTKADGTYVTDYTFPNIPIKKNYQTNISGAILTNSGSLTITVEQSWDGAEDVDVLVASSPEAATELLEEAAKGSADEISITVLGTEGGEIELPDTDATITITFLEDQTDDVTIGNNDDDFDGHAYVDVTTSGNLVVDLPEGSFTMLTGSSAAGGTIETEANTFTVNEGASIGDITVLGGNVTVYGTVGDITSEEAITVTVYDNGVIGDINGDDIEVVEIITGAILNLNNGVSYANVQAAIDAAEAGDVIELAAGEYTIEMPADYSTQEVDKITAITKDLTIQSEGAVIIPNYVTTKGNGAVQSTFFIENGATVTFDGLTVMSHIYEASAPYYANKVIEVLEGATFNMVNCVVTPNIYVEGYTALSGGGVYANDDATLNISNSTLYNSSVSAGNLDNDVVTIKNTVFDNSFISTPSWDATFMPQNSTMEMYVENCTFQNWTGAYTGTLSDNQIIRAYYGTITLNGCTFPSDAQYWSCPDGTGYSKDAEGVWTGGIIWVDGVLYTPNFFNYTSMTAYADYTTLMAGVTSGDEVYVGPGEYAIMGTLGKDVTIYGANRGIAGYSEERGEETKFISGSVYKANTAPAITIAFDGVEFAHEFKGFQLQYGGNFTMKNCNVSTANASMNSGSYIFYMHNAYKGTNPGICVFENNLFAPTDDARQCFWIWGEKASNNSYDNYVDVVLTNNVFTQTYLNLGYAASTPESQSTFEVTGNTFNGMEVDGTKSSYAMMINYNENGFDITGNIFNTLKIGVYYSLTMSDEYNAAIQANNEFNDVDNLTYKY